MSPPRKRAKHTSEPATAIRLSATPQTANLASIRRNVDPAATFYLPIELWLEIISYFPELKVPSSHPRDAKYLPASYLERSHVLRGLSQANRALRNLFLPMLYEHFHVCALKNSASTWYKALGERLVKKCGGLVQRPDLAVYVRTVTVVLTRYRPSTVLTAFRQLLEALPKLHTLQIVHAHPHMTTMFKAAFEGAVLPSVRQTVIPGHAHEILRCCPNVEHVMCNRGGGTRLVGAIAKACKNVEVLTGLDPDKNMVKRIMKSMPNLREFRFWKLHMSNATIESIQGLEALRNLRAIDFNFSYDKAYSLSIPLHKSAINAAKNVLRSGTDSGPVKYVRLYFVPPEEDEVLEIKS